jgi:hypothetical protein
MNFAAVLRPLAWETYTQGSIVLYSNRQADTEMTDRNRGNCEQIKYGGSVLGFFSPYILPQRRGYKHTLQRDNTVNSKQIFPEKELRSLSSNFHIHVTVSDLYISTIGLPILLQENINCSQTHEYGIWKLGLWLRNSFSGST